MIKKLPNSVFFCILLKICDVYKRKNKLTLTSCPKGHKVEKRKGETISSLLIIKNIIITYFGMVSKRALTCKGAKHSPKTSRISFSSFLAHNGINQFSGNPVNNIISKTVKQRLSR